MTRKNFFAVILACALVFIGGEAALVALPHSHGDDFDHSHHGACPVYQLASHSVDFSTAAAFVFAVALAFAFFKFEILPVFFSPVFASRSSRGPPAL